VFKKTKGDIIPIDGKLLRGSHDVNANVTAINIVGAYSTENSVLLGQVKTKTKSNEIVAIPQLLNMLDIEGCIVTIDAIGCQTKIASKIRDKKGDYVLAVKNNQPTLYKEIQEKFNKELRGDNSNIEYYKTSEKSHGRKEVREYKLLNNTDKIDKASCFDSCSAVGMVESTRTVNGEISKEKRYFILSFITTACFFGKCVRKHWSIENSAHYILDVAFKEDNSRIRKDHTPANMSTIRRASINMIKQEKSAKVGVANKRLMASNSTEYLEKIIGL
jgi:predicted transposase YbfD/YdcC